MFLSIYLIQTYQKELQTITNIENCSSENLGNILKELYKRVVIPFYIPILMLVPFLLITSSKENISFSKLRFTTFLVGLFLIIFSETTIRLISEKLIKNFSITLDSYYYFYNIIFIFF
jgi:lipopolysaccharide export system permease protein